MTAPRVGRCERHGEAAAERDRGFDPRLSPPCSCSEVPRSPSRMRARGRRGDVIDAEGGRARVKRQQCPTSRPRSNDPPGGCADAYEVADDEHPAKASGCPFVLTQPTCTLDPAARAPARCPLRKPIRRSGADPRRGPRCRAARREHGRVMAAAPLPRLPADSCGDRAPSQGPPRAC